MCSMQMGTKGGYINLWYGNTESSCSSIEPENTRKQLSLTYPMISDGLYFH